jgi:hypothetical protein
VDVVGSSLCPAHAPSIDATFVPRSRCKTHENSRAFIGIVCQAPDSSGALKEKCEQPNANLGTN